MSLEDIIEQQVRQAEEGGDVPEPVEIPETPEAAEVAAIETPETPEVAETEVVADDTKPAKEPAKAEDADEAGTILAAAGIKPPVEGQRENRIPYSRTHKIVENALKKERTAHTAALTAKDTEYEPLKARAQAADNWDRLITSDPDRTIRELARIHPHLYQKYLEPAPVAPVAPAPSELGAKPGPDLKYEDGTVGYSPEQFEKREAWIIAKATADANASNKAELDRRLGPMESERKAKETYDAHLPKVRADRERCVKLYGKLFTDDEAKGEKSEILKVMREQKLSIPDAAAVALVPKITESQTKMRADILKELKQRSTGAAKTTPGATTASSTRPNPDETRATEDIIRDAIAASGLR